MKNVNRFAAPLMAAVMMSGAAAWAQTQDSAKDSVKGTTTQSSTAQDWNTPPPGTEQAQQGYRDGLMSAKLDKAAHRPVDAKMSHMYVHPPVKGQARDEYRAGFEGGYQAAVKNGGL